MHLKQLLLIAIVISSCGGGGGGGGAKVPFALTLAQNTFSTNEDTSYNGSMAASANEVVTLEYSLTSSTSNGTLTFSTINAAISYTPNTNFFGQDEFTYSVTASEKNITRSSTVSITVNAVNDSPQILMTSKTDLDKNNLIFESNPKYSITFSDVDNDDIDLVFSASVNQEDIPTSFVSTGEGAGELTLDLSGLINAGLLSAELKVSDGDIVSSDTFNSWFIADKKIVTVPMDDDKSDGFDSGTTTDKDYYVYYLVGGDESFGRTDYLFVAD